MSDFPSTLQYPLHTIHAWSMEALGPFLQSVLATNDLSAQASATWPSANLALYIPFVLVHPVLVVKLWIHNGATASGNVDVGIYDEKGTRLTSAGSTAQSGTSALQIFDITDIFIGPGLFYMATSHSSTAGTRFRVALGSTVDNKAGGMLQQASAHPLPATATFATLSNNYVPMFGLSTRVTL